MIITLTNDFHNTRATCIIFGGKLNRRVANQVRKILCGVSGCQCSQGELGECGPQTKVTSDTLSDLEIVERKS